MVDPHRPPPRLLGAHVLRRADEVSRDGERLLARKPRQAEVENAQPPLASKGARAVEDEVRGLDVTVDDARCVRVLETIGDAGEILREAGVAYNAG